MKQYEKPTMTVEEFDAKDIITTSLRMSKDDTTKPAPTVGWSDLFPTMPSQQ